MFGTTAATWYVKVLDGSLSSSQYSFNVQAPSVPTPTSSSISPNPVPKTTSGIVVNVR
jgi:hypothetical protein